MPSSHTTVQSPNPRERSLVVTVEEESFVNAGGAIPPEGTRYSDKVFKTFFGRDYNKKFSDFIYTGQVGDHGLGFGRGSFDANGQPIATPDPFRSKPMKSGNQYWYPILLAVEIKKSRVPRTSNAGDFIFRGGNYTATPIWIPGSDMGSQFILNEYLSPVPYDIPQWDAPQPRAVSFYVPGQGMFNFPECLGPELNIERMVDSESSFDPVAQGVTPQVGLTDERSFPATNFKTWLPFYQSDSQEQLASGMWYRRQIEARPPNLPRKQRGHA